ncbi:MAG: adenylate/guanylate cyclase domain-containing protein [Nannocystaceae bacterium]
MENLPKLVQDFLVKTILAERLAMYVWLDADCRLGGCGGALHTFAETYALKPGKLLTTLVELLRDFAPHHGESILLPAIEVLPDISVDIYVFSEGRDTWFLMLNATQQSAETQRRRQANYEQKMALDRKRTIIHRYLGEDLTRFVGGEGRLLREVATQRELSVLFADIRGFTRFSNQHSPEEVFQTLNIYIGEMINVVSNHGGAVDKVIGDSVMAVFGLDERAESMEQRHRRAVQTGLEILKKTAATNQKRGPNEPKLHVGIGLASGSVLVGAVGSKERRELSVFGQPVNLASRLQEIALPGEMVLDEATAIGLALTPSMEEVVVKGYAAPIRVSRLKHR